MNISLNIPLTLMRFVRRFPAFAVCILLQLSSAAAADDIIDSTSSAPAAIELPAWKLLDTNASMTLEQVDALPNSHWEPLNDQVSGYHFMNKDYWTAAQGSVLWLKITLPDAATMDRIWLELLPNFGMEGKIALFDQGSWVWHDPVLSQYGSMASQPTRYLTFIINTSRPHKTAYLRLTTGQIFQFSLKARSVDGLLWYFMEANLFFGFVVGMLLLAMIYNLAIGLKAKESLYLHYAFYVFCNLFYSIVMAGYARIIAPEWGQSSVLSGSASILISLSAISFLRQFLETRLTIPRFDVFLRGILLFAVVGIFFQVFASAFHAYVIAIAIGLVSPFIALLCGILSFRQGHPMAGYFLIAWIVFIISASFWGWSWLGVVEPKEWVIQLYLAGALVELLLLSMVLGFRFNNLKVQTQALRAASSRYKALSETDDLTKILNRRGFIRQAEQHINNCMDGKLVWLAIDVDNFKAFNDQYGHPAGDELLEKLGELLNVTGRKENVIGRVGGEEFAILLLDSTLESARHFTDRLALDFSSIEVTTEQGVKAGATLSIGATALKPGESLAKIWKRADNFLYEAKEKGRNRVVMA